MIFTRNKRLRIIGPRHKRLLKGNFIFYSWSKRHFRTQARPVSCTRICLCGIDLVHLIFSRVRIVFIIEIRSETWNLDNAAALLWSKVQAEDFAAIVTGKQTKIRRRFRRREKDFARAGIQQFGLRRDNLETRHILCDSDFQISVVRTGFIRSRPGRTFKTLTAAIKDSIAHIPRDCFKSHILAIIIIADTPKVQAVKFATSLMQRIGRLVHLIGICIVRIHEYTTDNIKRTGKLVCFVFLRPHLGDIFFQETGRVFCILRRSKHVLSANTNSCTIRKSLPCNEDNNTKNRHIDKQFH